MKGTFHCHYVLREKQEGASLVYRGEGEVGKPPEETGFAETNEVRWCGVSGIEEHKTR